MKINDKIKLLDFKLTKNLWASLFWLYKSRFTWTWMDFIKHKEYSPTDSIKNIDWKTIWKTNKVYSKVYEDERDLKVLFIIDSNSSMNFWVWDRKKRDILEELFYSIALSSSISGDSIWAYIFSRNRSKYIEYHKGFSNVFKVINELNIFLEEKNSNNNYSIDQAFEYFLKGSLQNNLIFIFTDNTDLIENKNLKLLTIKNELIFFNIFDYFENNLSDENITTSLKDKNNRVLNIDLSDKKKVNKYKERRKEKIYNLENFMKKHKISYKSFDTSWDTFKELYLFFSQEKINHYN